MFVHFDLSEATAPLGWARVGGQCFFYFVQSVPNSPQRVQLFRTTNVRTLCPADLQTESERCGRPIEQPIALFQHAVTHSCSSHFYTIGKQWQHSRNTLHILRISQLTYVVDAFTTNYDVPEGCIGTPSLYCGETDAELFVSFNVGTNKDRYGREFVSANGQDRGGYAIVSHLYKVLLDEQARTFELVELRLPLPPLKMRMRIPLFPKQRGRAEFKIGLDELNIHILSIEPYHHNDHYKSSVADIPTNSESLQQNEHHYCIRLFTMNTDGRAHVFDGRSWAICENVDDDKKHFEGAEHGFCRRLSWHQLFSSAGRLFLLTSDCREYGHAGLFTVGALSEVRVDTANNTYCFMEFCDRVVMPKEKNFIACPSANCNFALSHSFGWFRPTNAECERKHFIQLFVDSPLPLAQLAFHSLIHAIWPTTNGDYWDDDDDDEEADWPRVKLLSRSTSGPYQKKLCYYASNAQINELVVVIKNNQMDLFSNTEEKMVDEYLTNENSII